MVIDKGLPAGALEQAMVALIAGKLYSFFRLLYRLRSAQHMCLVLSLDRLKSKRSEQGNDGGSEHTRVRQNR